MPFGPPVGGWFNAEGDVWDSSVFDFGPRTDTPIGSVNDAAVGTEGNLQVLSIARAGLAGGAGSSSSTRPTRGSHSRAWITTLKVGDSGCMVVAWQNGAGGTPVGVCYAYSNDGGLTWSAPAQIDATTTLAPSLIVDPNTNNIFVFMEPIFSTVTQPRCRVLPYTGVPGTPSWGAPTASVNQSGNIGEGTAVAVTAAGIVLGIHFRGDSAISQSFVFNNPWDHTATTVASQLANVGGTTVWQDLMRTENFGGNWIVVWETGGQLKLWTSPADSGTPSFTQRDSFFASNTEDGAVSVLEQYSAAYSDVNNKLCLAYVNGTALTYRIYTYDGTNLTVTTGPTVIENAATCHHPLVQSDPSGNFYIVWLEDLPSSTQRKIRVVNTSAPTVQYELMTDSGANTWKDLNGPRSTEPMGLLQFMVSETANATNKVFFVTVPIEVFKTLADSGTFVDGSPLGIEVSFGEVATAADDPQQTRTISPSTCQEGRTALDQWTFDIAAFDDPCISNDVADQAHATEILNLSPQLLETATGTEAFTVGPTFNEDAVAVDDFGITPDVVAETAAGADSPSVDQSPEGDQNDVASAAEGIVLEVLADDQGAAVEAYDIAPDDDGAGHVTEAPIGTEAYDIQTTAVGDDTTPADTGAAAEGTMDVGVQVDELGTGDEVFDVAPGGFDETCVAVEEFDVAITVTDTAAAVDSDPSVDGGISKDAFDTATAVDVFTVTHTNGLSVRLRMVKGNAKLRVEGNRQQQLNVRN